MAFGYAPSELPKAEIAIAAGCRRVIGGALETARAPPAPAAGLRLLAERGPPALPDAALTRKKPSFSTLTAKSEPLQFEHPSAMPAADLGRLRSQDRGTEPACLTFQLSTLFSP